MFNAFTPLAGGKLSMSEFTREPIYNTDAQLNFTRLPSRQAIHPYPQVIGFIQGYLPLMNGAEYETWKGKTPFGPYMGPDNSLPQFAQVFPNIQGGLSKVTG